MMMVEVYIYTHPKCEKKNSMPSALVMQTRCFSANVHFKCKQMIDKYEQNM